jgi:hypothetical protein
MEPISLGTTSGWPPFYAPSNIPIWALYNKCSLQIHTSIGPMDQIPALNQGILTSAYTRALCPVLLGASGDYRSTPETSTTTPTSPSSHYQQEAARWVITPLPNSSWILVSEGGLVGSGNLKDQWVSIPSPMESTMSPAPWGGTWSQICHGADR